MGYRSDVRFCMKKENFEEIREKVRNLASDDKDMMDNLDVKKEYADGAVAFGWDYVKWYTGYEIVDLFENYMNELTRKEIEYSYIRIGEDYEDIETRDYYVNGICVDKMSILRTIEIE